jgi:hypothetical protein
VGQVGRGLARGFHVSLESGQTSDDVRKLGISNATTVSGTYTHKGEARNSHLSIRLKLALSPSTVSNIRRESLKVGRFL